jgi:hypothetical protein
MVKATLIGRTKDKVRITNLKTTNPNHLQRMIIGSQRRILESGVRPIKSLGTTLMNAIPNNYYWLS